MRLEADGCPAGFRLQVEYNASFDDRAALSEGAYLLRSNITDWSDEQLWKAYIQLTKAEAAFRIQKDQLHLRPIWHQRADRVQAHILVCFLAFVLWKSLEMWQQRAGLGNSPRTVLEELARIQSHDIILPTRCTVRFACAASPSPTPPRPCSWSGSASSCPSACAWPNSICPPLPSAPERTPQRQKYSADFSPKALILLLAHTDSAQVRLSRQDKRS